LLLRAARAPARGLDAPSAALIEMATLARLFGTFRPAAISRAIAAAAEAIGQPGYVAGSIVMPSVEPVRTREYALAG
jgi:hypothetical protein